MLANYNIEPIHLRTSELNYELRIRGVAAERVDVTLKRKYLKRELRKDLARPEVHIYTTPNFDFEIEKRELNESIRSVTELVNDYDGNSEIGARVQSRINHILGRLSRLPEDSEEISSYRGDNIITVSALEEELVEIKERIQLGQASAAAVVTPNVISGNEPKSVPVYKWPVKFDGSGSVNSFLQRVDELRVARKCTKETLFEAASDLFEDVALEWFRAQFRRSRFSSWDTLVSALKTDFLPLNYDDELWKQIEKRTQHEEEPIIIYLSIMENLFECLSEKPSEQKKLRILMTRVLPCYQSHLTLQDIQTVDCLAKICRKLEESENSKKRFNPPPQKHTALEPGSSYMPSSSHRSSSKDQGARRTDYSTSNVSTGSRKFNNNRQISVLQCWQCNKTGHRSSQCRQKSSMPTCFGCGRKNVIRPNCPNCSKN